MSSPTAVPNSSTSSRPPHVIVIGGGPAGLMAAEALAEGGARVDLYDAMPSVGRKFLLAGKGGLNLTHSEPLDVFVRRYGEQADTVAHWLDRQGPRALRDWAEGLGIETFVGSSGKVFPAEMKSAPLLRAWLRRLRAAGVTLHMRHRWNGVLQSKGGSAGLATVPADDAGASSVAASHDHGAMSPALASPGATPAERAGWSVTFEAPTGSVTSNADAVVLALGGASWPKLGSNGAWWPWLAERGVALAPLRSANCAFDVAWSPYLRDKFSGSPLKGLKLSFVDASGETYSRPGEAVLSADGLEGPLIYAASARLRDTIAAQGPLQVLLDLAPTRELADLAQALSRGRGARSWTNHLREYAGLHGAKAALLREGVDASAWSALMADAGALAARIKALPLTLLSPRPMAEAISTAGGVCLNPYEQSISADETPARPSAEPAPAGCDASLMLTGLPGVFCAGEMLDWEAPTGGYLLTATMASGRVAGEGVLRWWRVAA
ncbi:MAG: NAD(P)/FAD-dependent oxidoreductase [Burkholderiales bacterium]|nr:NAD(P)/FAD-dependent oxidoreductase [Burkholderiales bacterium]